MEWKEIALGLLSVLNLFLGWWAHKVWARLDKQEDAHNALRLFVAENYAKRSEFDKLRDWLDDKFNNLYDRINDKADKP